MAIKVLRASLLRKTALLGAAMVMAQAARAQTYDFNLPGQPLSQSLDAFARISGRPVIYASDLVEGKRAQPLRGKYAPDIALADLVKGTGLVIAHTPTGGVMIEAANTTSAQKPSGPSTPAPPPAVPSIETVVVTAQHKSENIQQVPIAITALSQAQLTERQIAGGPDLVREVPNLTFSKTNFTGYNLEIRGIGTQAISVTTDPAVAVAFNDIPFIRNHFFEQEFYDLQDVEVLRGPQGTLYGRNATAGVVNIKSALPTDQYEAMLSADLGNYSNRRLEGMLNLPIVGDTLDLRIAGEWTKRNGYSFNTLTNQPIDGRDLWSGRASLRWRPNSDLDINLVWEHFSEDDDRMRTAKQLCKTAPIPASVEGVSTGVPGSSFAGGDYLSQGCLPTSLYSADAFEVPNGYSLTYYSGLTEASVPVRRYFDVYSETTQSQNLRDIESSINPIYKAKNDTVELNTDYQIAPSLKFTSQTGYNNDFLWSTEDYNRFNSAPGAFVYSASAAANGYDRILLDPAAGKNGIPSDSGVFCDPQLGCSDRLVAQDLSDEHAWQLSQEFRLASNFSGPLNFSVGGNYLHYETEENYYVFINALTLFSADSAVPSWVPGVTDNHQCSLGGFRYPVPEVPIDVLHGFCRYIDPNPLSNLNNEGHNYFLNQNPYTLNSYAGFGEVYYNLTDDVKLTGGLRWTEDQKHFLEIPSLLIVPGYGYAVTGVVDQQWDQLTGHAALNWTPKLDFTDQTLVYGSYAHGYKAGGANPPGAVFPTFNDAAQIVDPIHPLTFKPEFVDAFELGSKNTLLDGALTLNGDIFFYNYKNYQISEIVDRTAINLNFNATVKGAEFETDWEPVPGLKFSFAGGYEDTRIDNGQSAVDLMDRTAGNPDWMVVKPYVTEATNCVLPAYVVAAVIQGGQNIDFSPISQACSRAYVAHEDPVTALPYVANPTVVGPQNNGGTIPAGYPGFDPVSPNATNPDSFLGNNAGPAPNNGEGFAKPLGGNQLPSAPHFTTSLTAEYTMPVSEDWAATLHSDFYWQSQSWARVFNDNPYDKIYGYSNVNLSLILTSTNGWQVMGYVKNVFDTTAITGDFLNSDDSGLTTNVFLTDPRLYGVRVTKQLDQDDGFWGSDYSGADFFSSLFSDEDGGEPSLWITLGGQLEQLQDAQQPLAPPFVASLPSNFFSPRDVQKPLKNSLGEEVSISFEPDGSDWVISASIRYGRAGSNTHQHQQTPNAKVPVDFTYVFPPPFPTINPTAFAPKHYHYALYPFGHFKLEDATAQKSETHTILDFEAGKDVGLGLFGGSGSSILSAGVRIAQFTSKTNVSLRAEPDVHYQTGAITSKYELNAWNQQHVHFHDFAAVSNSARSFTGVGPKIAWDGSTPVTGDEQDGEITFDWGANGAILFGRQKVQGRHQTNARGYYGYERYGVDDLVVQKVIPVAFLFPGNGGGRVQTVYAHTADINRSRTVIVPNLGGFIGASVKYRNAKVSFGYRGDFFFGAMDGGIDTFKSETRGFYGPFATLSIGLGG